MSWTKVEEAEWMQETVIATSWGGGVGAESKWTFTC